ncbi:hypothetical protein [Caballeronia telluris]|uniref:hypothetical protein n=1 Tax=Caballeronia telluris TaxID=326475 RepID=UPI000F73DC25|nr:hypothetical protein [Caballeronia telluris]
MELPAGKLIDCHDLAWAVARYRFPFPEEGATGMSCITGSKMVDYSRPAIPSVRPIEKPRTLLAPPVERIDPTPYAVPGQPLVRPGDLTELWFPERLTNQDKVLLAAMLVDLPTLKYPMSEWNQDSFLTAYREKIDSLQLVGERYWEPILATGAYVERQRRSREQFVAYDARYDFGEEFARGLDILNPSGNPVLTFDITCFELGNYFLYRKEVHRVLNQYGMLFRDGEEHPAGSGTPASIDANSNGVIETPSSVVRGRVSERISTTELENDESDISGEKASGKMPPLTKEEWLEIVKLHARLESDPEAKKSSAQVASQFNRSDSYIRRIIRMSRDILRGASDQDFEELATAISAKYDAKVPVQYVEALVAWERRKSAGATNWVFSGKT